MCHIFGKLSNYTIFSPHFLNIFSIVLLFNVFHLNVLKHYKSTSKLNKQHTHKTRRLLNNEYKKKKSSFVVRVCPWRYRGKTHHCHDNNNKTTIKKVNSFIKHTLRQHPDEKIQGHTNTREQSFFFIIMPKGYVLRV